MLQTLLALTLAAGKGVPGVVIDHVPKGVARSIGSPSIAILPNGDYVASAGEYSTSASGLPNSGVNLYRSRDRGQTWTRIAVVTRAYWSNLFVWKDALYLMGTSGSYGRLAIRRSDDGGATWTPPAFLSTDEGYHTAPVPMAFAQGRVWRAFERRQPASGWAENFRAGLVSAPIDADLLDPMSWTTTNLLASKEAWNSGDMHGWLEGNAIVGPNGGVIDVLRVDVRRPDEKAALVRALPDGQTVAFDPESDLIDFPGGSKKFTIRFDPPSQLYWTLASTIRRAFRKVPPSHVRNTLSLTSSPDLVHWTVRRTVLSTRDVRNTGFQYVDWQFDGDDLVAVSRTAWRSESFQDANYLTFHRVAGFRDAPSGR